MTAYLSSLHFPVSPFGKNQHDWLGHKADGSK